METEGAKRNVRAIRDVDDWDREVQDRFDRIENTLSDFVRPVTSQLDWIRRIAVDYKWQERQLSVAREYIRELQGEIHDLKHHGQVESGD